MNKRKNRRPGITQDLVFGYVMSKEENCLELLRRVYPELHLKSVEVITQRTGNFELGTKGIRLDVWAKDDQGRVYDIEMQNADQQDLGQRMQYYATGLNKFTLKSGEPYPKLKSSYVLFLCTFDPFGQGESLYEFEFFDKKTKTIEFKSGMHITVLNSKGKDRSRGQKLLNFSDYMNGIINHPDSYITGLQQDIDEYINSGRWASDMNKLEYELNQVALKTREEDSIQYATRFIKLNKQKGIDKMTTLQDATTMFSSALSHDEIAKLIEENY